MAAFEPTVAVICPLSVEMRAVLAVFNDPPKLGYGSEGKPYYRGIISKHSTVAICLPNQNVGVVQASRCGDWLQREFPSLQHRFLVGIAGGIPDKNIDIRLGDIVIGTHICKYDSGKWVDGELQARPALKDAPQELQDAIPMFQALPQQSQSQLLEDELMNMRKLDSITGTQWIYPDAENAQDVLFEPGYACPSQSQDPCSCDHSKTVERGNRQSKSPKVHYGLIASGDQVMKDDKRRDKLKDDFRKIFQMDVLAVEMEAAGLADLGYMVFRGICDYADSHKNKKWQEYAAGSAAACFKTFLARLQTPDPKSPKECNRISLSGSNTLTHLLRTQSASAVDMKPFTSSRPGHTDLHDRPQKSFAEGCTSNSNIIPKSSIPRTFTYNGTSENQGQGVGEAGPPFPQPLAITPPFKQPDYQQSPTASPVTPSEEDQYSPDCTASSTNSSPSQDHSRDSSPYSTVSNRIITNTTVETRRTESVLERDPWKWSLSEYCCDSKLERHVESSKGEAAKLSLFQTDIFNEPLKTSRTIEVYDISRSEDSFVSWIPLDGLQVSVQDDRVHLQYSNCNAQQWDTVNGMGQYHSIYNDRSPNISTHFVFADSKSADEFARLVLHVDCVLPGYHHLEEFRTLSGICKTGTASEIANQPSTSGPDQQRATIIINIDDYQDIRISSVFGLGSCFEYDFQTSQGVITISLGHLRKAHYKTPQTTSPNWPPHWVRQNPYGLPDEIDYDDSKSFAVRFSEQLNDDLTWKAFMMKVTGWQLRSWQNVQMHGRNAQMGVWLRESSLRLLCKARVRKGRQKWYCLDLSTNHINQGVSSIGYRSEGKNFILKKVLCSEGKHINQSMTVQPAHDRQNKPSDKKLKFTDEGKAQEFEAHIKQLLTGSNSRFSPKSPSK